MISKYFFRKQLILREYLRSSWIKLYSHQFFNSGWFRKSFSFDSQSWSCLLQLHYSQQTVVLFNDVVNAVFV